MNPTERERNPAFFRDQAMEHWELVNRLARKRFPRETDADEAALYVLDTLAEENWERLGKFSGRSRFSTFFSSVAYRLLEDFARKKFGRVVPPKWIREAGGIWLLLFRLLCLERFSFHDAIHLAAERRPDVETDQAERAAETVLAEIPDCGKSRQHIESTQEQIDQHHHARSSSDQAEERESALLCSAIGREILGKPLTGEEHSALSRVLRTTLVLEDEEKLLLRLCYRDGMSVAAAGKLLGLNRFQVHGRMRRTMARIRQQFTDAGCDQEIRLLLTR